MTKQISSQLIVYTISAAASQCKVWKELILSFMHITSLTASIFLINTQWRSMQVNLYRVWCLELFSIGFRIGFQVLVGSLIVSNPLDCRNTFLKHALPNRSFQD